MGNYFLGIYAFYWINFELTNWLACSLPLPYPSSSLFRLYLSLAALGHKWFLLILNKLNCALTANWIYHKDALSVRPLAIAWPLLPSTPWHATTSRAPFPLFCLLPQFYCQNIKHLYPLSILVTSGKRNRIAASVVDAVAVAAGFDCDIPARQTHFFRLLPNLIYVENPPQRARAIKTLNLFIFPRQTFARVAAAAARRGTGGVAALLAREGWGGGGFFLCSFGSSIWFDVCSLFLLPLLLSVAYLGAHIENANTCTHAQLHPRAGRHTHTHSSWTVSGPFV